MWKWYEWTQTPDKTVLESLDGQSAVEATWQPNLDTRVMTERAGVAMGAQPGLATKSEGMLKVEQILFVVANRCCVSGSLSRLDGRRSSVVLGTLASPQSEDASRWSCHWLTIRLHA